MEFSTLIQRNQTQDLRGGYFWDNELKKYFWWKKVYEELMRDGIARRYKGCVNMDNFLLRSFGGCPFSQVKLDKWTIPSKILLPILCLIVRGVTNQRADRFTAALIFNWNELYDVVLLSRATKELSITHIHSTLYQVTEEQLNLKNYGMKISIYVSTSM